MSTKCVLSTDGYEAGFDFGTPTSEGYSPLSIYLHSTVSEIRTVHSIRSYVSRMDIMRLVEYIQQHIQQLTNNFNTERVFVTHELAFQIGFLTGFTEIVDDKPQGSFGIRIMLNVGRSKQGTSIYVGMESEVDIEEINKFVDQLNQLIAENNVK